MSHAPFRLDGLLLVAAMVVGTATFLVTVLVAAGLAIFRRQRDGRPAHVAGWALGIAVANGAACFLLLKYLNTEAALVGPDIVGWFSLAYALIFVAAYVFLFRLR